MGLRRSKTPQLNAYRWGLALLCCICPLYAPWLTPSSRLERISQIQIGEFHGTLGVKGICSQEPGTGPKYLVPQLKRMCSAPSSDYAFESVQLTSYCRSCSRKSSLTSDTSISHCGISAKLPPILQVQVFGAHSPGTCATSGAGQAMRAAKVLLSIHHCGFCAWLDVAYDRTFHRHLKCATPASEISHMAVSCCTHGSHVGKPLNPNPAWSLGRPSKAAAPDQLDPAGLPPQIIHIVRRRGTTMARQTFTLQVLQSIYLSIYPSVYLSFYLSVCLSSYPNELAIYLCLYSTHLSISLSVVGLPCTHLPI